MSPRYLASVVAAIGLLLVACSGDDATDPSSVPATDVATWTSSPVTTRGTSSSAPDTSRPTTTGSSVPATSDTPTTPPPSDVPTTAPKSLESVLQALLAKYDAAVTTILTDPRVANDPASPAVTAYLALFAPGSTFAQGALASWAQDAADGRSYRPGPDGSMIDSSLLELDEVSDTEASFVMCSANSLQVVDAAGNVIESSGGVTFVQATAELIDGQWLFRDLSLSGGDCPEPGTET